MLRPERMSRVSIAGSEAYLEDVIEELHDLNLLHVTDYDGSWEGFDNGTPLEGGEAVSEKLLQVRAIENKLDLDEATDVSDLELQESRDEAYDRLDEIRQQVNELDDRRAELEDELRTTRERVRELEPFADLGLPLELLRGYSSVDLRVGRTSDRANVVEALEDAASVEEHDVIGDEVVAVVARTEDGGLGDALAGVDFAEIEVPDEDGDPAELISELETRAEELETEVEKLEEELRELRDEHAGFLLALEEDLSIEAEKSELPLQFAATENSFYAEGWIPEEQVEEVEEALSEAVGDHVDFEVLETAEYDRHGHPVDSDSEGEEGTDEDDEAGHEAVDDPPVKQDNPGPAKPFELLVNTVNRPKYTELDPTMVVFLTFPFAFGFMIGDMGYGVFYMLMGGAIYRFVDNDALKALGVIGLWAGFFTVVFGYLYGDAFGVHISSLGIHPPMSSVISKGIQAADIAQTWLVASIAFGLIHLNTAYVYGFFNHFRHDLKHAFSEYVSWMLIIDGFFLWVFSLHGAGMKPEFLVGETSVLYKNSMFALGFQGLPASVGLASIAVAAVGVVMMVNEEGVVGAIEMPAHAFGHVLSYLRIMAVLLAKGGMAFVVNLLVFGAYSHGGKIHFALYEAPSAAVAAGHAESVAFPGLVWLGIEGGGATLAIAALAAVLVFALGHVLVLLLGITAAGIQMVRLEYVEFFGKFYEGGGREFDPFGRERKYTEEGG